MTHISYHGPHNNSFKTENMTCAQNINERGEEIKLPSLLVSLSVGLLKTSTVAGHRPVGSSHVTQSVHLSFITPQ